MRVGRSLSGLDPTTIKCGGPNWVSCRQEASYKAMRSWQSPQPLAAIHIEHVEITCRLIGPGRRLFAPRASHPQVITACLIICKWQQIVSGAVGFLLLWGCICILTIGDCMQNWTALIIDFNGLLYVWQRQQSSSCCFWGCRALGV